MTKLEFTPDMFECCIRADVHKVAQLHHDKWLIEVRKWCPCGGIISADTEDLAVPLCLNCYNETINLGRIK